MDRILTLKQYKDILIEAKSNGFVLSNCFFLAAELNRKIGEGTFLFKPIQNGLLLLDDLGDFYRCYYFLSSKDEPGEIQLDKDAVIELPFNSTLNGKQLLQVDKIKTMGFCLGRESGMMWSDPKKIITCDYSQQDKICCLAEEKDAKQVLALMTSCFNPLYAFLPSMNELCSFVKEGRVLVIRDGMNIAAALISGFEKRIATIKHVAVDPDYRGKDYGKVLLNTYHNKYKDIATSFQHWVDLNNTVAVSMYRNFGYEFNLRKANEYIFIVKEKQNERKINCIVRGHQT